MSNDEGQSPRAPHWPADEGAPMFVPPGHYYSPVAHLGEIRERHDKIFSRPDSLPGIDLREDAQLALLEELAVFCDEQPFGDHPANGLRYGFVNDLFGPGDGLILYAQLRRIRPKRYLEIGSGWSSALALDVVDRYLDGQTSCSFVEPYPERLDELLSDRDRARDNVRIYLEPLYRVDPRIFAELEAGDVLFIDSTHVSKAGSDVNQLLLDVIPTLPPGIHVHVHDVFFPFEYPPDWIYAGRSWSEDYVLRALLINNSKLRITWFNDFMAIHHGDTVRARIPLWGLNPGGSIWLETQ